MTRYWAVAATVLALLLVGFLVAEAFDLPLLADPTARLASGGVAGALLAVALLTADAVLPVPASLVMVAAGGPVRGRRRGALSPAGPSPRGPGRVRDRPAWRAAGRPVGSPRRARAGRCAPAALGDDGDRGHPGVSFFFFFFGSFVFTTVGSLLPTTGDQDLFLHVFSPTGTTVSSSSLGGTSLDVVWFTFPFFPCVPVFEVKGFTAGVCGTFAAHGA